MGKASSQEPAAAKEAERNYRKSLQRHLEQWPNQKSALSARRWLDERLLRDDDLPGVAKLWVDALPVILDDPASLSSLVSRIAFSTFPLDRTNLPKRIRSTPSRSTNRQLSLNPP